jgi:formiminoglutamate deiminase
MEVADGAFTTVDIGVPAAGASILPGVVLPGFADVHGHAFHRALRGRTHDDGGTFWTWRERMYAVAERLDPDTYLALARATYAELALAGVTTVGEFHYLHHGPGGVPYDDPNTMAAVLRQAADEAGVRLTLIDACYLRGGFEVPLAGVQLRFADRDVDAWAARVADLNADDSCRIAAAAHSVRAVPAEALPTVAAFDGPLHVHLSEQPAENDECLAATGRTPTRLLDDSGFLGPRTTVVHATHLDPEALRTLGERGSWVCACPTTERDLADGIGPMRALADAGARLALGTDQHVYADLLGEARALEDGERLTSLQRGRFSPPELLGAVTAHEALGWHDVGAIAVGRRADLVAVPLDRSGTAGIDPAQVVLAPTTVDTVIRDGDVVVSGGRHVLGDVGRLLVDVIGTL